MNKITTTTLAVVTLFTATSFASANEYQHINSLASKIKNNTKILLNETRHYRHTANYAHMVEDLQDMLASAKHIKEVARYEGDINHLAADLRDLDRSFHHIEDLFDQTEAQASRGHGHAHGNTKHVKKRLNRVEELIHHMLDDVKAIRARLARVAVCPYSARPIATTVRPIKPVYGGGHGYNGYRNTYRVTERRPSYGSYGHYNRGGVSFGNGSHGISFGF